MPSQHMKTSNATIWTQPAFAPRRVSPSSLWVEANGGVWGPSACKIFSELAKTKSVQSGEQKDKILGQLYQNLDVVLQRENSRAILRIMDTLQHNINTIADAAATVLSEVGS